MKAIMRQIILLIFLLGLSTGFTLETHAQPYGSRNMEESKARIISKRKAIQAAQRQVKGKVLSADLIKSRRPVYRVKMLVADKRVRTIIVDGQNGRVIRKE